MPCVPFRSADGKTYGFVCTRGRTKREVCEVCGKPASKLCDFPLSGKKAGQTCDRKLCLSCATEVDVSRLPERFDIGKHHGVIPGGPADRVVLMEGDTVDVCPAHARFIKAKEKAKDSRGGLPGQQGGGS